MEIRDRLEHGAAELQEAVRPKIAAAKERLSEVNTNVVGFIKAYPAQCLVGAVALGYLVGRIARAGSSRHAGD